MFIIIVINFIKSYYWPYEKCYILILNKKAIEKQIVLRKWVLANLPIKNSLIGFDLLMEIALHNATYESPQNVKQLFASLPQYSYTAIRSHYFSLLKLKLILLTEDPRDKRVKYVVVSDSFKSLLNSFLEKSVL